MKLIYLSAAMSLDGRIDDQAAQRLVLSTPEDLQDVYAQRANCDAILVGANTIRRDNPSLLLDSVDLVSQRVKRGQNPHLLKVTVTESGDLDPKAKFFTQGDGQKFVICPAKSFSIVSKKLSEIAKILPLETINASNIVLALEEAKINSLFIEGGTSILTMFLSQGIFHRFRLAIAPFFVGDSSAPPLINPAQFNNNKESRLKITSIRNLGNMAVLDMLNEGYKNG